MGEMKILHSYNTTIAFVNTDTHKLLLVPNIDLYSKTTMIHLNEFLQQLAFSKMSLSDVRKQLKSQDTPNK